MQDDTEVAVRRTYLRTLTPGEAVYHEGDPGDHLYVIQAGEIELVRSQGGGRLVVAHLGPGAFFGEQGVVLGERRSSSAVVVSPARVIALDRVTLEGMCLERPEIAVRMIRELVSRWADADRRLAVLGVGDLLRPIVRAILHHAEPQTGSLRRFGGQLRDLAGSAGLSLLEAHRALHQLIDGDLVTLEENVLQVPNAEALSAILDG